MGMRKILPATIALTTMLSVAGLGDRAAAMTPASPSTLGAATARGAVVRQAHVVCAGNGCTVVQVSRVKHPKKQPANIR
jgi:hypothetical protein